MHRKNCPHCLSPLDDDPKGLPRSVEQLRRYFAVMRAIYHYWPETHSEQFTSMNEMRKWLQMKAGHRKIAARIPLAGVRKDRAMMLVESAIRGAGHFAFPVLHGNTIVIFKPKSIGFHKLGHIKFCQLNNEVDDVIRAETGLDPDECLNAYKMLQDGERLAEHKAIV